ncbi:NADP-reducing hydrogenase, subunit B [Desulfamplus magnetovallimortis]|uniref:NADP-reducing hydrogenase, subunit B n=1 Tax=Desulfamplus magnetovallimortis TaxID=1246637 RepID=A0A1W1H5G8_9BACT|nr:(2Fe-2S) ferredoxin domain-containing protein [Desulfamplus magnetovallimortis]SLM27608.1 NADP-reducing hydrogenase, subunit B [Desulfamplus magnetovallimortis]
MAKITIEDLKKIREKASHTVALRSGDASVTVTVHMGQCGIDAGAREVMKALLEAKAEADRSDIKVLAGECLGKCETEPNMTVDIKGGASTLYQKMDVKKTHQVFASHILGGEVQNDFII